MKENRNRNQTEIETGEIYDDSRCKYGQ